MYIAWHFKRSRKEQLLSTTVTLKALWCWRCCGYYRCVSWWSRTLSSDPTFREPWIPVSNKQAQRTRLHFMLTRPVLFNALCYIHILYWPLLCCLYQSAMMTKMTSRMTASVRDSLNIYTSSSRQLSSTEITTQGMGQWSVLKTPHSQCFLSHCNVYITVHPQNICTFSTIM